MLGISLWYTLVFQPEPTGIYEPQNILLLPGINDYVPSTFAVWFAFVLTIAVHEFGHAILCRIEGIRVKSIGVLFAVIPIGFFVEPDEDQLQSMNSPAKARMFGAGITNNIVVGIASFLALMLVIGAVVPPTAPIIHGVYSGSPASNFPAAEAGVPPGSVIRAVNGEAVANADDVARVLNTTGPGDQIALRVEHQGTIEEYQLTLAPWPNNTVPYRSSGYMGISYYRADILPQIKDALASPAGILLFVAIPFEPSGTARILAYDTPEMSYYQVPFPQFWGLVHLLFWSAWININVGIFNAIPMVPLDGGYIFKEAVDGLLRRRGLLKYSTYIVSTVSFALLAMMLGLIALPYLLHI